MSREDFAGHLLRHGKDQPSNRLPAAKPAPAVVQMRQGGAAYENLSVKTGEPLLPALKANKSGTADTAPSRPSLAPVCRARSISPPRSQPANAPIPFPTRPCAQQRCRSSSSSGQSTLFETRLPELVVSAWFVRSNCESSLGGSPNEREITDDGSESSIPDHAAQLAVPKM